MRDNPINPRRRCRPVETEVDWHVQACGDTRGGPSGSGMANVAEATANLTAQAQEGDATAALRRSNEELQQFGLHCLSRSH